MRKEHWALISLVVNLLQSLVKLVVGVWTGSLSLIGEAVHSAADSMASVIAYITVKFSEHKSERFPYGLYRLENLGSIAIAFFLLLASYEIMGRAISGSVKVKEDTALAGLSVALLSMVSSLTLSLLERRAAKKLNSPTLMADSYHTLTDFFGSSLVFLSFLGLMLGFQWDRYFAGGVALLIAYTGLSILKKEVSILLDVSADEETLERIRSVINSFPQVKEIKHLFVRASGGRLFMDLTIKVEGKDFYEIHHLIDTIEEKLREEIPQLEMAFIHYEPATDTPKVAVLMNGQKQVAPSFREARYLLLFSKDSKELLPLPQKEEDIAQLVVDRNISILISGHHPEDPHAKTILGSKGVFVWETCEKNPYRAVSEVVYNLGNVQNPIKEGQGC